MENQKYIFYYGKPSNLPIARNLEAGYSFKIWRPKIYEMWPKGLFFSISVVWWLLHILRIFKNSEYKIFLIYYNNKEVANYSVVLPKYFRTPFLGKNDLQIGPVGTAENHRRKGLAFSTIQKIFEFYKDRNIKFWYVARKENEPSLLLAEKIGLKKYGEGAKKGILKKFIIEKIY